MKTKSTSISLLIAIIGGPILVALTTTSCVGPAARSKIRQETRVENRTTNRQNNRRGW